MQLSNAEQISLLLLISVKKNWIKNFTQPRLDIHTLYRNLH